MSELAFADLLLGLGGMALGVERAGFAMKVAYDLDPRSIECARANRPQWSVQIADISDIQGREVESLDLISAGLPSPSTSMSSSKAVAEREHVQVARECLRVIGRAKPRAVLLEATLAYRRPEYRSAWAKIFGELDAFGYQSEARMLYANSYGVPQRRPRLYIVAILPEYFTRYDWPYPTLTAGTVGSTLRGEMSSLGWSGAAAWAAGAAKIAPTIVGGSRRHGGADLGPSGSKAAWWRLGVDPTGVADLPPSARAPLALAPRLTTSMLARLQGLDAWEVVGSKTKQVQLVGSATPPPVAQVIASAIRDALVSRPKARIVGSGRG